MVELPQAAADYYRTQQALALIAMAAARRAWGRMGADFDATWARVGPELMALLTAAQGGAVTSTAGYLEAVLAELGLDAPALGVVEVAAIAGVASDGRALPALLYSPVAQAKSAVAKGMTAGLALELGGRVLDRIIRTQVADAGRTASTVGLLARPKVTGYVRMLNLPSCKRCVVLAGRWYRASTAFPRHEGCDCRHIPATEDMAGDLRTDPQAAVAAGQVRGFTKGEASAVESGADINQVVNARRGMPGLTPSGKRLTDAEKARLRNGAKRGAPVKVDVGGRMLTVTDEGKTSRGLYGSTAKDLAKEAGSRYRVSQSVRLTPDAILEVATGDQERLQLLKQYGYLLT